MFRLSFDISDENRGGNCFEVALHNQMDDHDLWVCHGVVRGQGPLWGIEFPHAWNEFPDGGFALDESNGNSIVMPVSDYYAIGGIDPASVRRYDFREVCEEVLRTGVYGPWDTSLDFDYREI